MNTRIVELGLFDNQNHKHSIHFQKGLNVITGKSSTGKSAVIEIFDYCFAASENTIPKGVITDYAELYFVILLVNKQCLVLARKPSIGKRGFVKRIEHDEIEKIQVDFFEKQLFIPMDKFKKELRSYFLDINDVDESLEVKALREQKAPTPSVRSFASFMLQHQNLIANKHALFYRFDEKEKRDQLIEHTKIFLGVVDQKYFILSQEKELLETELRKIDREIKFNKNVADDNKNKIEPMLRQLYSMAGIENAIVPLDVFLTNPNEAMASLDSALNSDAVNYTSSKNEELHSLLIKQRNDELVTLRNLQRQALSIKKNIDDTKKFAEKITSHNQVTSASISSSICPFCHSENKLLPQRAESLKKHIEFLNDKLAFANPVKSMYETKLFDINKEIEKITENINKLTKQISQIEADNQKIKDNQSLIEVILNQKARLRALVETLNTVDDVELDEKRENLKTQIDEKEKLLNKYNVKSRMIELTEKVNSYMAEIGKNFDFEQSYKPINLKFSFETFDLYHLNEKGEKVYLRSMGSGANWLYSHITLFLALHRLFTELGDKCSIPTIVFFDQPTQVYFPDFNRDNSKSFAEQKEKEIQSRKDFSEKTSVDDDMKSVENLFSQLSIYCNELETKYTYSPQIIVTDHADNLTLSNGVSFESLVHGNRWRDRGFINPVPKKEIDMSTKN